MIIPATLMASKQPFIKLAYQYTLLNKAINHRTSLTTINTPIKATMQYLYQESSIAYFYFYKLLLILLHNVRMHNGLISYIGFISLQ